ncbi:hypothetical protein [Actinoplanes solisilvae]|uniref:hypothetical protein n=1 Tax=Actinoplanes solisilvae TaxID=2486853 RepID=UPI000FDCB788|nr:hypothetical protein [Actinoplanes solisilvae]
MVSPTRRAPAVATADMALGMTGRGPVDLDQAQIAMSTTTVPAAPAATDAWASVTSPVVKRRASMSGEHAEPASAVAWRRPDSSA